MPYVLADAHTDFLMHANTKPDYLHGNIENNFHVSREGLKKGNVALQIFAVFNDSADSDVTLKGLEQVDCFYRMLETWEDTEMLTRENIDHVGKDGKLYAVLAIEGAEAIGGSIKAMHVFRRLGLRVMTLTWNHENEVGFPAIKGSKQGLKPFGKELIREMNASGIAVDVSHLNVAGFWDAIEVSEKPIMASHSNALAQCDFPRNLHDKQIKAIIDTNGYIGLNFCDDFMRNGGGSDLSDVVRHAHHILDLGGENVLGMGSDFDGITDAPKELSGVQDFGLVMQALSDSGIDEAILHKIAHKNLLRYLGEHIK